MYIPSICIMLMLLVDKAAEQRSPEVSLERKTIEVNWSLIDNKLFVINVMGVFFLCKTALISGFGQKKRCVLHG